MLWNIAAPFFKPQTRPYEPAGGRWIDDFVESDRHAFRKIAARPQAMDDWHSRSTRGSGTARWLAAWEHAGRAMQGADGLITVFPQLAAVASARQFFRLRPLPHVAWCYNIGELPTGPKQTLARATAAKISKFVVHSAGEAPIISEYLGVPQERVVFFPLQISEFSAVAEPDDEAPFIVSLGSANRDYETLLKALEIEKIPTVIVAAKRVMAGVALPPHVKHLHALTPDQCYALIQRARFCVVPLKPTTTAAGQVTVVDALRTGRAVVATRAVGTIDYVQDGVTGFLVAPGDPAALGRSMRRLWDDPGLARRFGGAGMTFARSQLSDPVAARNLLSVLDSLAA